MTNIILDHALSLVSLIIIIFTFFFLINSVSRKIYKDNNEYIYIEDLGRKQFEEDQDLQCEVGLLKGKIPDYNEPNGKKVILFFRDDCVYRLPNKQQQLVVGIGKQFNCVTQSMSPVASM